MDREGHLDERAMKRTIDVLAEFRLVMDRYGVTGGRATATAAAREAGNAGQSARRATEVLGVAAEVLDGEEEGRLTYLGAMATSIPPEAPISSSTSAAARQSWWAARPGPPPPCHSSSAASVAQAGSSSTIRRSQAS